MTSKDTRATTSEMRLTSARSMGASSENRDILRPTCRIIQNYLLLWLDANLNEDDEDFKNSIDQLKCLVLTIATFTDPDECVDFLSKIENEKVFMIVSGDLGEKILPTIESWSQLKLIYVFSHNQSYHEQWTKKISKIKGVYTNIKAICDSLQIDRQQCDRAMIPISFNKIDPLFMYTQFLKEALLEIDDDDNQSMKDFLDYCREQSDPSVATIEKIENEYYTHSAIWWYTAPFFLFSMLNRGLREMDVNIILKMGFFIRHLHQDIANLHAKQQEVIGTRMPMKLYRGQSLSSDSFEKLKQTKGGLMAFNNFLSTSYNREISLYYGKIGLRDDSKTVGILFVMNIDPDLCKQSNIPFVNVSHKGYFQEEEAEILFTSHTIFRINRYKQIDDAEVAQLWEVELTLVGTDDHELNDLISHIRGEFQGITGWFRLASILVRLGENEKAEQLYNILLKKPCSDIERAACYNNIAGVYDSMGKYSKALSSYERSLEISKIVVHPNHPLLATSYNNIAGMYYNMGEHSKALSSYEQSLEIMKIALPPNHPDLATSYNNIGVVHINMGEYSKALTSFERALEIMKIVLPSNHPILATSYNNIGMLYIKMGEHSKALSSYEQSLEIRKTVLPPNHPELATSYNNIGMEYINMGEYSKALTSFKRSLEIMEIALPPNHPSLVTSYSNIGVAHMNMGEHSEALSSYERSLEIGKIALPLNHPKLATSHNNIAGMYYKMGEHSKALSSYEQSLEIMKIALPPNHPDLATSYNNIGMVYMNMGEYSKALSSYEQSLEIRKIALPPNHPDLTTSYNSIAEMYYKMGEHSKALEYSEKVDVS